MIVARFGLLVHGPAGLLRFIIIITIIIITITILMCNTVTCILYSLYIERSSTNQSSTQFHSMVK